MSISTTSFLMDGPDASQIEQLQQRIKAMPRDAVEVFLTMLDMRFISLQAECGVPNEHLQRVDGRKQELKDLKDSIVTALADPVIEPDSEYTEAGGVTP